MSQILDKPVDECTLEELKQHFEGTDASLEVSLGEYGLACTPNEEDGDWFCIIGYQRKNGHYTSFYTGYVEEEELHEIARDQGKAGFYSYIGAAPWVWKRLDVIRKIQDLKDYLGPENVFGSPGSTFQMMALLEKV